MGKPRNRKTEFHRTGRTTFTRFDKSPAHRGDRDECFPATQWDRDDEPQEAAAPLDANWATHLPDVLATHLGEVEKATLLLAIQRSDQRINAVEMALSRQVVAPYTVHVATLAPQGLRLKKEIPVLIQPDGDDFTATFIEANIGMSGETDVEAVNNLKEMMAAAFKKFESLPPNKLGPGPTSQLAILREFIEQPTK